MIDHVVFSPRLQNDVIILDEAHNVEKICEEAASVSIASSDLALCITEVTSVRNVIIYWPPKFIGLLKLVSPYIYWPNKFTVLNF